MHPNTDDSIALRFDTVIYDLDGTLIDSAKDMQVAVSRVLADHGLPPVTEDDVRIFMGQGSKVTMGKAFTKYGKTLDDAALSAATASSCAITRPTRSATPPPSPAWPRWCATSASSALKQGVCTNKFERPSRMILEHLKLMPPITDWPAPTPSRRKPDPRHILMLVERMGRTPDRAVMVGDSIHDVEAAHAAGLPAVLVSWGYTAKPASELGAEAVIERFDALPQALAMLAGR